MATRGSRRRSNALTARGIDPICSCPSANSTSVPLIRGEPSWRRVAMVRCLRDAISERTRDANWGAAASNSAQLATPIMMVISSDLRPLELGDPRTELRRKLVAAVLRGEKIATASLREQYGPDTNDPLPLPGESFLLAGYDDEPVGVVKTTDLRVVRAGDVDLQFARDEGEGFATVGQWRSAHERAGPIARSRMTRWLSACGSPWSSGSEHAEFSSMNWPDRLQAQGGPSVEGAVDRDPAASAQGSMGGNGSPGLSRRRLRRLECRPPV